MSKPFTRYMVTPHGPYYDIEDEHRAVVARMLARAEGLAITRPRKPDPDWMAGREQA